MLFAQDPAAIFALGVVTGVFGILILALLAVVTGPPARRREGWHD